MIKFVGDLRRDVLAKPAWKMGWPEVELKRIYNINV